MKTLLHSVNGVFQKYLPGGFFRRVFSVYLTIILSMILVLFAALSWNLSGIKREQSLRTSDQIIQTIDSCLEGKLRGALTLQQRLFQDRHTWDYLMDQIDETRKEPDPYEQQTINRTISRLSYGIEQGFGGILVGSYATERSYVYSFSDIAIETRVFQSCLKEKKDFVSQELLSARMAGNSGNAFSIFVMLPMRADDYRMVGCMAVFFNAMDIRHAYQDFDSFRRGDYLVLSEDGDILYHSEADYAREPDEKLLSLLTRKTGVVRERDGYYNIFYSSKYHYYIVNRIPNSVILADVWIPLRTMLVVFFLTLLAAGAASFASTHMFARRIEPITDTIDQIKSGNLTSFPLRKRYDDEIGYIYTELLRMCASLDEHIQTEYVYQLREKEMELYMLQTQIDPHFLYNTLEAIRMKLYMKGESEASHIIYTLAGLFRSMMNKDAAVTVREETDNLRDYLELFRFRMGEKLSYSLELEPETLRYSALRHTLQPIVENALVHGIEKAGVPGRKYLVQISCKKQGDELVFTIQDDGCGMTLQRLEEVRNGLREAASAQSSIGIYNVNRRLVIVYGPDAGLCYESEEGRGTTVTFRIRAWKKKELEEHVKAFDRG